MVPIKKRYVYEVRYAKIARLAAALACSGTYR